MLRSAAVWVDFSYQTYSKAPLLIIIWFKQGDERISQQEQLAEWVAVPDGTEAER